VLQKSNKIKNEMKQIIYKLITASLAPAKFMPANGISADGKIPAQSVFSGIN
jgi:hypothetical protein